jgi:hypothetical protein
MNAEFLKSVLLLKNANRNFADGKINPQEHKHQREESLAQALHELAMMHGVKLQTPLQLDSNGEFSIVALNKSGEPVIYGAGQFGNDFVAILNKHSPRTGVSPGATLLPSSGWCRMNHFDVENMIMDCSGLND